MAKKDTLLSKLGGGLADSIGIREGESTTPSYQDQASSKAPRTNYVRSRDTGEIDLDEVMPDPEQPRKDFDEAELERLAASIKDHGLLQPIRVRWSEDYGKWLIVAGERRWRAHKIAELGRIKCTFDDSDADETTIRSQQIIENCLREDLTGMELARSLKNLMEHNKWSAVKVAAELNMSKGKVSKALSLLKLPEDIQEKVEQGSISAATGYQLSKVKDKEEQSKLAAEAATGAVTCEDAAKQTKTQTRSNSRKTTNEVFKTEQKVRIAITSRRDIGEQGMINALLEVADEIRKRSQKKAA